MRTTAAVVSAFLVAGLLTACAKEVNIDETKAKPVPGTPNLYRFCDSSNLIYFRTYEADDDSYEFFIPGGCEPTPGTTPGPVPGVNGGGN
jgi:hypothetical protein